MTLTRAINAEAMVPAKPFETSQQSQLKLIAPYVDLPLERLMDFPIKQKKSSEQPPSLMMDEPRKLPPLLVAEFKCFDLIGHNLK